MDGIRLLVVEDDLAVSAMWVDLFTESGAEVLGPCGTSAQALALLTSQRPDVALLHIEPREGASFVVARALRVMHVPFVFLASDDPSYIPLEFAGAPYLRSSSNAREVVSSLLAAAVSNDR